MLVIGVYEKNVVVGITDDKTGEIITRTLLSPDAAIVASKMIMDNVKQINPGLVEAKPKPKPKPTTKPSKKTTKKK